MSSEGHQANLALFFKPPLDKGVQETYWQEYRPVGQISHGSVLEFDVSGSSADYTDLKKTKLYARVRILRRDGAAFTKNDHVGLVNLSLQSLFRQVDVGLQQQVVSPGAGTSYPFKAVIETLLHLRDDVKLPQLHSQLYYKDSAGQMDATSPFEGGNAGLLLRSRYINNGALELEGPIYSDICDIDRLLLNGIPINVKFYPSRDNFCLMTAENDVYRVEIEEVVLKLCKVKVTPNIVIGQSEALKKNNAIYCYPKTEIKAFNIAKGAFSWTQDDIFQGRVPQLVVVGLVSSAAYSGDTTRNPFNFKNYNLNFAGLYIDGHSTPSTPLQPNYATSAYVGSYLSLFSASDSLYTESYTFITRDDFPKGYAIYVFKVNETDRDFTQLEKRGNVELALRFATPLEESATVLVYARFPGLMQVDQARNIII